MSSGTGYASIPGSQSSANPAEKIKQEYINHAASVGDQSHIPGGRNENSTTTSYIKANDVGKPVILDSVTTAITIGGSSGANDTLIHRIIIHTALAGTLTIAGFTDSDGAAKSYVFPIATPAGSYEIGGINSAGTCQATLSSATDYDRVMIVWSEA